MYMVRGGTSAYGKSNSGTELSVSSPVYTRSTPNIIRWAPGQAGVRFLPPPPCGTTSLAISPANFFLPMLPYALAAVLGSTDKKNVYGDELVTCSTDGMAMTGFTRDGFCTECADGAIEPTCCADPFRVICTTAPTPSPQHRRRCRLTPHMHHHVAQRRGPPRGRQLLRADWARNATE